MTNRRPNAYEIMERQDPERFYTRFPELRPERRAAILARWNEQQEHDRPAVEAMLRTMAKRVR